MIDSRDRDRGNPDVPRSAVPNRHRAAISSTMRNGDIVIGQSQLGRSAWSVSEAHPPHPH